MATTVVPVLAVSQVSPGKNPEKKTGLASKLQMPNFLKNHYGKIGGLVGFVVVGIGCYLGRGYLAQVPGHAKNGWSWLTNKLGFGPKTFQEQAQDCKAYEDFAEDGPDFTKCQKGVVEAFEKHKTECKKGENKDPVCKDVDDKLNFTTPIYKLEGLIQKAKKYTEGVDVKEITHLEKQCEKLDGCTFKTKLKPELQKVKAPPAKAAFDHTEINKKIAAKCKKGAADLATCEKEFKETCTTTEGCNVKELVFV